MAPQGYSRVLEVKLVSAQDLARITRSMKTYAVVCVDPERKLTTRVDQTNEENPVWDEKFVFRLDDKFLNSDDAAIEIEIYAAAWVNDALIGTVHVLLSDLFAPLTGLSGNGNKNNENKKKSSMRFVGLQVHRPSGRPQGILNMGVALLDSTLRSMPLATEVTPKHTKELFYDDDSTAVDSKINHRRLLHSQSDRTDLTISEDAYTPVKMGSVCTASTCTTTPPKFDGSVVNESSLCSDVGPSASVVAAAIAKGLYQRPKLVHREEVDNGGHIKVKVDRIRTDPLQQKEETLQTSSSDSGGRQRRRRRRNSDGKAGKFSCFGKLFGCEISITCCGDDDHKKKQSHAKNKVCHLSSVNDGYTNSSV